VRPPPLFFSLAGGQPVFARARAVPGPADAKELRPAGRPCPVPFNRNVLARPLEAVYVCEGCVDTLSALQLGWPAVGIPGVHAFRDEWFALFPRGAEVVVLFDDDEAGRAQASELRTRFRLRGFRAGANRPPPPQPATQLLL